MELGSNAYGKAGIRVVRVHRLPDGDHLRDLTVDIGLDGDFAAAYTAGDNRSVVATDTMKNTAYVVARDNLGGAIERYAAVLGAAFLRSSQVERAIVSVREHRWARLDGAAGPSRDAFARTGDLTRTARVTVDRSASTVESGLEDLTVLKTTKSAFEGFPRDGFTTLAETADRILATRIAASWSYGALAGTPPDRSTGVDFDAAFEHALDALLRVFADHESRSVQHTIWVLAGAILEAVPAIEEVTMSLPNLHHWLVDLSPFGLTNEREVYLATTEPYGRIEATVRRGAPEP